MAHTSDKCPGVTTHKRVTFNDCVREHNVPAYSSVYGVHPSTLVATPSGLKTVSADVDPFTGKSGMIMRARIDKQKRNMQGVHNRRRYILALLSTVASSSIAGAGMRKSPHGYVVHKHMVHMYDDLAIGVGTIVGTLIEESSHVARSEFYESVDALCAARTASTKNKFQKRQGAKAVKKLERLESKSFALSPDEATMHRALSARANYLAQDRPDIAFSTKELCREFAVPNKDSYVKLKRVCRYLVGLPRLVYNYRWQDEPDGVDIYVDTDFAGCKTTRRSTSGGVVLHGTHCIRHW